MLAVRRLLDEALQGLRAIASEETPVADVERELVDALVHAYRALAAAGDYRRFREEADATLARGRGALAMLTMGPADPSAKGVVEPLRRALKALPDARPPEPDEVPELPREGKAAPLHRAMVGEPRLVIVARGVLEPAVPIDPIAPPPEPPLVLVDMPGPASSSDAELDAMLASVEAELAVFDAAQDAEPTLPPPEPPPPPDSDAVAHEAHYGHAETEEEARWRHARGLIDELGMHGLQRRPTPIEPWLAERTEERLLCKLDALIALGPTVWPRLVELLEDRPLPDATLTWALVMLFGAVAGDDARDQVMRLARCAALEDPLMRESVTDALSLAPHPRLDEALAPWLSDADPARRAVAVLAMGRRGSLPPAHAERLLRDPSLEVVRAAAEAWPLLEGATPAPLVRLLGSDDEALCRLAMEGATLTGSDAGITRARALLASGRPAFAGAALLVAIAGDADTRSLLLAQAAEHEAPILLEALGWLGHVGVVDFLIGRMSEKEAAPAAIEALFRILGVPLEKGTKLEEVRALEVEELPFGKPFSAPERPVEPCDDPEVWRALWKKHGALAPPGQRHRFGSPWTHEHTLWELGDRETPPPTRRLLHLEIAARTGGRAPFSPWQWGPRQRRQIDGWREHAASRRGLDRPGSFSVRVRR